METVDSGTTNLISFRSKQPDAPPNLEIISAPVEAKAATEQESVPKTNHRRTLVKKTISAIVAAVVLPLGANYAYQTFQHASTHEETDDAYVTGHLHQVSTRINGTVDKVLVDDNEYVKQGQLLVLLDPRDFKVQVEQALANLELAERQAKSAKSKIEFQDTTAQGENVNARGGIDSAIAAISSAQAKVREGNANIHAAEANLGAKQAELERAALDFKRFDYLAKEGAISFSERDSAKRDYLVALETRNNAREGITQATERFQQAQQSVLVSQADLTKAQAQVVLAKASTVQTTVTQNQYLTDLAAVDRATAALKEAQLNLSYTNIVAPTSGRIGKKTAEEGQRIEPGQPLLSIVSETPWVVANYKETQLKNMHNGQTVEIKIDSFPDHKFRGTLQSFSPASGASFSILPSDNATGNFTKIVQRVPVKVVFDTDSLSGYENRLAPGLSVTTSVDVGNPRQHQSTQAIAELR